MSEAGLVLLAVTLPCILLGVAIATGKLPSHSAARTRDPVRARRAEGIYLIVLNAVLALLGVAFLAMPERMTEVAGGWLVSAIVVGAFVGLIPVFRAHRT